MAGQERNFMQELEHFLDQNQITQGSRSHLDSDGSSSVSSTSKICLVCGDVAGLHNYYGGQVCSGCRAFFRRCVQRDIYQSLGCVEANSNCLIDKTTRRRCQGCRFRKCLLSGMKITWVLSDHERKRRYQSHVKSSPNLPRVPDLILNSDDTTYISDQMRMMDFHFHQSMDAVCRQKPDFIRQMAVLSYYGGNSDYQFYQEFNILCNDFVFQVLSSIQEFRDLPWQDCQELFSVNSQIMIALKHAVSLQETDWCFVKIIERALKSGQFPMLNELGHELAAHGLSEKKPQLTYNQVFSSPWAANGQDEDRHLFLTQKMQGWPRKKDTDRVDDVQMNLLKLIILFSTEFVTLERGDIVEHVQMRFIRLLQKYLKFKYGSEAGVKLGNGLLILSYAKEVIDIQQRQFWPAQHWMDVCALGLLSAALVCESGADWSL
eukprot:snap_masked-scaffold28_size608977-processed-gene-1.5 protein:Tk05738 transcript:snap_masked-scaffold28_size608977-processed-gene-1.5-mRNA-1 annotation:"thyroid hormone receptor alpha 1"